MSREVTVVYLAREKSGLAAYETFLRSYTRFPAGMEHELAVVFKGFAPGASGAWREMLTVPDARCIEISDGGFDLRAYGIALRQCQTPYTCCLNSFSELLADDWLAKLYAAVRTPGVALAGATGSWESMYSNALNSSEIATDAAPESRALDPAGRTRPQGSLGWLRILACRLCFLPFPNPHLRTNAFIMRREMMRRVWPSAVLSKRGAYLFENGRRNLLRRVRKAGGETVVVGRDGATHTPEAWPESLTFRQRDQPNLLVADNQTRAYQNADSATRRQLSRMAWGNRSQT